MSSYHAVVKPLLTFTFTKTDANNCIFAALAFVIYDWLISLDEEIRCFWNFRKGRKVNAAVLLYGLSRYPPMLQALLVFQTTFRISDVVNQRLQFVASLLGVFPPAIFPAIRAYAVSPNSKLLAISACLLLLVPNVLTLVLNAMDTPAVLPSPLNCSSVQDPSLAETASRQEFVRILLLICHLITVRAAPPAVSRLVLGTKICNIIGEGLVLFVTWRKTYESCKAQGGIMGGPSLAGVMLYNGGVYFIMVTVMYILALISAQFATGLPPNFSSIVTPPMTTILTCHFLFALHQADRPTTTESLPSAAPSLVFASFPSDSRSGPSSGGTLPAFIASFGSEVHTGLHFVDSAGMNVDVDMAGSDDSEEIPREEALAQEEEGEVGVVGGIPVERADRV